MLLFAATSIIWGGSFLFIRVAVEHMPPSAVVFGRTLLGAVVLVPLAVRGRAFRGARRMIAPVAVVALIDVALPTFLTAWGEERITSSVAGILTATDPLFTAVLALWLIRSEAVNRRRFAGLVIGFAGVIALLGLDFRGSTAELLGGGAVLYRRWLADAPAVAVTALMTAMCSVVFVAPAAVNLPRQVPPVTSVLALVTLGIVNTGLAYWLFYLLIDEAGAVTASVITYVMPVVALLLGVSLLGEKLTIGALAGLMLIALGAWLATGRRQSTPVVEESRTANGLLDTTFSGDGKGPSAEARSAAPRPCSYCRTTSSVSRILMTIGWLQGNCHHLEQVIAADRLAMRNG